MLSGQGQALNRSHRSEDAGNSVGCFVSLIRQQRCLSTARYYARAAPGPLRGSETRCPPAATSSLPPGVVSPLRRMVDSEIIAILMTAAKGQVLGTSGDPSRSWGRAQGWGPTSGGKDGARGGKAGKAVDHDWNPRRVASPPTVRMKAIAEARMGATKPVLVADVFVTSPRALDSLHC